MQPLGFVHNMMDVKILILIVTSRVKYPVNLQQIYELCFQDDCLSYFDICTALPEMVKSGHLKQDGDYYEITEKGRETEELTATTVAYSVRQRAQDAVLRFNRRMRRSKLVKASVIETENGEFLAELVLRDDAGELMRLAMIAPDEHQARMLRKAMEKKAELIYNVAMTALLDDEDDLEET